ncbi:MAG: PadR family transcriptional regulator [Bacteroidetes bacterium]|nr:PadR family transcriptional regulator [Bacteroidota bacterium]
MTGENSSAQMRKGVLEYCILLAISSREVYAGEILEALREAELLVVEGTLYPILSRMKNAGWLRYRWEESSGGPPRKYYSLSESGHEALRGMHTAWESMSKGVSSMIKQASLRTNKP